MLTKSPTRRWISSGRSAKAKCPQPASDTDVVEGRFVDIVPGARVVQAVDFVSDDPAYAGTMRMIWEVIPVDANTRVEFRAEDVPSGISAADHATGLNASLDQLAAYVEQ